MNGQALKDEIRDAVSLRTIGLVAGVLLLQLAFIASYVGAFHHPVPHDITVGVVAPAGQARAIADRLDSLEGRPLDARVVSDAATARDQVSHGDLVAALLVDPGSPKDTLLVASGGGSSLATAVEQVLTDVDAGQQRSLTVTDVVPLQPGDARGLSGFYLVIGWLVGGYLVASLLGVAKGARPANRRRAAIRLASTVPYAVASGLGGALVVDQGFGALTGHFWALSGLGTLLVLSAATTTMAFQVLFGTIGIGLTVLLFVVLGNPSAGGAYQNQLLPGLWRTLGPLLPNGAGTEAVRQIIYFGGGIGSQLLVVTAFIVVGAAVTALATRARTGADA
ncbi:MAG: hypothetical protein JWQ74_2818 [Marmoricola sp.]|nr:hypothetical protein [Marmoricola sp.]